MKLALSNGQKRLANYIKDIAIGPHQSKDLTRDQACDAMSIILSGEAYEAQAAAFFIGLRMKRETEEENLGMLDALNLDLQQVESGLDHLVILSDPFNGLKRHMTVAPFLPALLAAAGLPTVLMGTDQQAPKFGITPSQIYSEAGKLANHETALQYLNNPAISWAYLQQENFNPGVYKMQQLRQLIVKRPALATLEKLVLPVKAKRTTLVTGYVHIEYGEALQPLIVNQDIDKGIILKGIEGGIIPPVNGRLKAFILEKGIKLPIEGIRLDSNELGFELQSERAEDMPATINDILERGIEILSGSSGPAYEGLLTAATLIYATAKSQDYLSSRKKLEGLLTTGKAKDYFNAYS
ncbi:MAG: glycosyl transferase [Lentisphaeria bacterium]|nr:glycosyl transferase [Lentisphaeria bacterium]